MGASTSSKHDLEMIEISWTFEEGRELDIRNEEIVSDLERERMKKLDKLIGTNTYFHEIKSYEERVDS